MNTCEQQKTHKEHHKCTCTPTHHCSWNLMKPTTSALVSLSHTHTHLSLSLSLSLPLFPSLSPSLNSRIFLESSETLKSGRVFILLITFSSGSYTSFQDRRIARYLSGVWGRNWSQRTSGSFWYWILWINS